ncbi:hypothetical protein [Paludibaculum fermentans]|uniref:Uncharacterized protein n=1 Tax=Paludibaculum fermentans TaxID=1473598 RepID=A0A7S7NTY3_PALFE|nr:hypothetical protein [Paludibaculum fermentans]QOY89727.1 hypothetical protein IRI77_07180 [Paludibaculum fermentans]
MGLSLQSLPPRILTGGSADQSWQADAGRYRIEFTGNILEDLRFETSRAMNGYACLGMGGVLLGRRSADGDVVEAWKTIACDHSRGPGFLLSARDEAALSPFLEGICAVPDEGGETQSPLQILGWFVSHPKGDLEATDVELELHSHYWLGQGFLMIVRPDRLGDAEVQIYLPSSETPGQMDAVEPQLIIEPQPIAKRDLGQRRQKKTLEAPAVLAALSGQQLEPARLQPENSEQPSEPVEPQVAQNAQEAAQPAEAETPRRAPNPRAIPYLLAFSVVLMGLGVAGFMMIVRPRTPAMKVVSVKADPPMEMLSLHATHHDGEFVITWNGTSASVRYASGASLELHTNGKVVVLPLSRKEMLSGEFRFKQKQGTAGMLAKLVLQGEGGGSFDETTEIAGAGVAVASMLPVTPEMVPPARKQKN